MPTKINIIFTKERIEQLVDVGEMVDAQEGKMSAVISIASKFVVDEDGKYMDPDKALIYLRKLKLNEMAGLSEQLFEGVRDAIIPPPSGAE